MFSKQAYAYVSLVHFREFLVCTPFLSTYIQNSSFFRDGCKKYLISLFAHWSTKKNVSFLKYEILAKRLIFQFCEYTVPGHKSGTAGSVWVGHGWILPLVKWIHFFLGPWLLVCQFVEISNQMELNGEV